MTVTAISSIAQWAFALWAATLRKASETGTRSARSYAEGGAGACFAGGLARWQGQSVRRGAEEARRSATEHCLPVVGPAGGTSCDASLADAEATLPRTQ
jgi:hypothetical protein